MNPRLVASLVLAVVVLSAGVAFIGWSLRGAESPPSPYAGEQTRAIKSLSAIDLQALQSGTGEAFGGIALPAELNGYPGPRHALELAAQLDLSPEQRTAIETLNAERAQRATALGEQIIEIEQEIDDAFAKGTITTDWLRDKLDTSASLYGELRFAHLNYHLKMVEILTPGQVARYNELRGYTLSIDHCGEVPEGHDPESWMRHNDCG